jgi:nicotinamide riboside kinase
MTPATVDSAKTPLADPSSPLANAPSPCLMIAVLGAECTGKSDLCQALAERLREATGLRVTAVPEWLRTWCDQQGRTPRAHEQAAIAAEQDAAILQAAQSSDVVVADTTALMTAIYSQYFFHDASLMPAALAAQSRFAITLVTALDMPWVADGVQRDGPHVQAPVTAAVRDVLLQHALPWAMVSGLGPARLESALDAVAPLLRQRQTPKRGLFTRLTARNAEAASQRWSCELCDDPDCEHALRSSTPLMR